MTTKAKLDFIQLAKELTRSDSIDVILAAAKKLENYIENDEYGDEGDYCLPENAIGFIEQAKIWSIAGIIPLTLHEYQKAWVEYLSEPTSTPAPHILISARQMGLSTVVPLYALWTATRKPWTRCVIVTPRFAMTMDVRDKLALAIEAMGLPVRSLHKTKIVLENDSEIDLVSYSDIIKAGFRDVNLAVFMDAAYYSFSHTDDLMRWTRRQIHNGAQVIVASSSSRTGGVLHSLIADHAYPFMSTPWSVHPDRDEKWADNYRKALGPINFAMEMECQFVDDNSKFG